MKKSLSNIMHLVCINELFINLDDIKFCKIEINSVSFKTCPLSNY